MWRTITLEQILTMDISERRDNMQVKVNGEISAEECKHYQEYVAKKYPQCKSLEITVNDDESVDLKYFVPEVKFDRIRRIA